MANINLKTIKFPDIADLYDVCKYDDLLNVIRITSANTTMGDIVTILGSVNSKGDHVVFDVAALDAGMYLCTIYIGSGYYRIADLVTGFEGTGFFDANDKLADIIASGSQSTGNHYTMVWDKVNSQGTRLNDAASITLTTTHFGNFGSVDASYDNPFDSIYPWSGRKLCNIDIDTYMALTEGDDITDCVVAWEGDVNFNYNHQYGVWVYTPAFFGRSYEMGNYRYFDVTDENLQNNIAYPASIVGRWLGVDVELTIGGASKHCNLPKTGMPMANVTLANMHAYAKNFKASLVDIYNLDATSLLFIVEYASMNLQDKLGSGASDIYKQTMHPVAAVTGSTMITVDATHAVLIPGAIVDIGTTDGSNNKYRTSIVSATASGANTVLELADAVTVATTDFVSVHGVINKADEDIGSKSGYIGTNGKSNAYYRGQTFYANIYQYILGAYRQKDTEKIWVAEEGDTDNYDALDTTKHKDTGVKLPASGWIKALALCEGFSFVPFPTATGDGAGATNPVGDYVYVPTASTANTVLLLGGSANGGASCGWYGYWAYSAGVSYWYFGSCPRLLNP